MQDIFDKDEFETKNIEPLVNFSAVTEKEKFLAAKQILIGLAILYIITMMAALWKPSNSTELLDICKTIFPPLATLILANYFSKNGHD